jgi:hypothetical protein
MWYDNKLHRVFVHSANADGAHYSFPSLDPNFTVHVAVPSDRWMRNAVSTALRAANAGIRLQSQCRVVRVGHSRWTFGH